MTKKTLGYVDLEWTCRSCGKRNPGTAKACQTCGTAMPEDQEFDLPVQQKLDTSAETAARVAAGPDIHCAYCGARNPGGAAKCAQCGAELTEGAKRSSGEVVGAFDDRKAPDVACPHCGAANPATATKCSQCGGSLAGKEAVKPAARPASKGVPRAVWVILALVAALSCWGLFSLTRGGKETVASVKAVQWTYSVEVEELGPVTREAWHGEVPAGAQLGSCTAKVRRTQSEPAPGATEVCGTPYVQDTGTGKGKVIQDCQYQIPDEWCKYTVQEWRVTGRQVVGKGNDLSPTWGTASLKANQREKSRGEEYQVSLAVNDKEVTYHPRDLPEYQRFAVGSKWLVKVNALGGVTSVQPAR